METKRNNLREIKRKRETTTDTETKRDNYTKTKRNNLRKVKRKKETNMGSQKRHGTKINMNRKVKRKRYNCETNRDNYIWAKSDNCIICREAMRKKEVYS